jgi:integrase
MEQMHKDIMRWRAQLEEDDMAGSTIGKHIDRLNQFIRVQLGLPAGKGPVKHSDFDQWGYYDNDADVEVYTDEELSKFFTACDGEEHLLFSVFTETGFRAQEVSALSWDDVDFHMNKLGVSRKRGFNPKTKQAIRKVTVSRSLMARLKMWKETHTGTYVFQARDHGMLSNSTMLKQVKAIAKRAGLNPDSFYLHKFRHTAATNFLRDSQSAAGALKMLMGRMGHKDLETTEVYLSKLPAQEEQDIVERGAARVTPSLMHPVAAVQ